MDLPVFGKELVLIVDDDDTVRNLAQEVLRSHGYRTITAEDGHQALDLFLARHEEISLVLLDLLMPNMGGEETYDGLAKIRSDVKVILCSGYSENDTIQGLLQSGICHFLQKPYRPNELLLMVREMLEAEPRQPDESV